MQPLAYRLRPKSLDNYFGQQHIVGFDKPLRKMLQKGQICSMILCGPPGVGKTTLAEIISNELDAEIYKLSAVTAGVKDIRKVVDLAQASNRTSILFLDEIHRFNKAQQDLLLPYIESGLIILIGATTENPYFVINNALLSRVTTFRLKHLDEPEAISVIDKALEADEFLLQQNLIISLGVKQAIYQMSSGDVRMLLNILESIAFTKDINSEVTLEDLKSILPEKYHLIDNQGDYFYDQLSAFHKSVRGTDPDAALFWLVCMIDSGCDPVVILRRMLCIASEDIGNADPRAITLALNAWQSYERLGLPEGMLPISQAATYLASAPKSNAAYLGFKRAKADLKKSASIEVPLHLRNVHPAGVPKSAAYKYPHDYPNAFVDQTYRPDGFEDNYYQPTNRGLEIKIKQKIDNIRAMKK
jgi:putative ATPase